MPKMMKTSPFNREELHHLSDQDPVAELVAALEWIQSTEAKPHEYRSVAKLALYRQKKKDGDK